MSNKPLFIFTSCLLSLAAIGAAAPMQQYGQQQISPQQRPGGGEDINGTLRLLKNSVADLKHEMQNHEHEISIFENRMQSQEAAFESLRQQLSDDLQSQRDYTRASSVNLEGKTDTLAQSINNLETIMRGLTSDLRQVKTQANDTVTVLGQYKQKIVELEGLLLAQGQHMQNLEVALQSMMEVWQAKEVAREAAAQKPVEASRVVTTESGKTYKVQPGDSIEKIARANKISMQALREANQLTSDKILIGQTLKIPD